MNLRCKTKPKSFDLKHVGLIKALCRSGNLKLLTNESYRSKSRDSKNDGCNGGIIKKISKQIFEHCL